MKRLVQNRKLSSLKNYKIICDNLYIQSNKEDLKLSDHEFNISSLEVANIEYYSELMSDKALINGIMDAIKTVSKRILTLT